MGFQVCSDFDSLVLHGTHRNYSSGRGACLINTFCSIRTKFCVHEYVMVTSVFLALVDKLQQSRTISSQYLNIGINVEILEILKMVEW